MKKIISLAAAALFAMAASAQSELKAMYDSKSYDNWYIGVNGGLSARTKHVSWTDNLNANAGVRIGHWYTPVFGLALEGNAYFGDKPMMDTGTIVKYVNTGIGATVNLSNWLCGYKGEPRFFEVIAVPTVGMGHVFASKPDISHGLNDMTGKLALDLAFNVDRKKCVQLYLEPAILYSIYGNACGPDQPFGLDINRSHVQLNAGLVYKFKNTNGSHNFRYAEPQVVTDQYELDRLNARIAELMAENEELRNRPLPCVAPRMVHIEKLLLESCVIFDVNKSDINAVQYANIERVANCMKENKDIDILITGYASTEGNADYNQQLSEQRAEAVKTALVEDYGIEASRLKTQGQGATDRQSDRREFNRVATFKVIE